ncbi:hypothetical protein HUU39_15990 [candidate division KSB1 bacterium]|nr:hypothetical protein [bacterium]NUM66740.1 hypothetical protein [candidate division KSB1 bacterium]
MFDLVALCVLILIAALVLKGLLWVVKIGFWTLTLPLQIIGGLLAVVLLAVIAIPLGLLAGILGLIMIPFALLSVGLPLLLIVAGLYLLLRQ